jgi:small conductance mechanosensitive channel
MELLERFWLNNSEAVLEIAYKAMLVLFVLIGCKIIAGIVKRTINKTNRKFEEFDATLVPILVTSSKYLVYTIGLIIVLDIFGIETASIIALLGAMGLAVGFALKDTLSNIAAGLMLLILRPFRVKDFIEFGSVSGSVSEINLFTTILETSDGIFISAPNSNLWGNSIKNFTRNPKRRIDIIVGIGYEDSLDTGLKVLNDAIASEERILTEPAPRSMVVSMGDSSMNLQLRAWVNTSDYWECLWHLNKKLKEDIEAAGLSIPFPQRDLHIIEKSSPTK